jgi:hypothetical protein
MSDDGATHDENADFPTLVENHPSQGAPNLATAKLNAVGGNLLFKALSAQCFNKCIAHFHGDGELTVGEGACADRCTSKYLQVRLCPRYFLQKRLYCTRLFLHMHI